MLAYPRCPEVVVKGLKMRLIIASALGVAAGLGGMDLGALAQSSSESDLECKVVIHCARGQGCDPNLQTDGEVIADFSKTDGWETMEDGKTQRIMVSHELGRLVIERRVEGTTISRNLGPNLEYTETRVLGPEISTSVGYCSPVREE